MKKLFMMMMLSSCLLSSLIKAQNIFPKSGSTGIFTKTPNTSAALDIDTTGLGILIPRMTKSQRDAITSPAISLLIYQTDNSPDFYYYNGNAWVPATSNNANRTLSNLVTTAINQNLVPDSNSNRDIGTSIKPWRNAWFNKDIYINGLTVGRGPNGLYSNTVFGRSALNVNTSGYSNTALGYYALYKNMSGYENTAIGTNALYSNTSGNHNTAIGNGTLYSNTTGSDNIAVGVNTLFFNVSGLKNSAIGDFSLESNTTGSTNIAHGYYTLYSNTTGYSNIAIGASAMYKNTKGSHNIAVGDSTLLNNIISEGSVAIGSKTLLKNMGDYNTALGISALPNNTTGNLNVGIGDYVMYNNDTGRSNTIIGHEALYYNKGGRFNAAVGSHALFGANSDFNSGFGFHADVAGSATNSSAIGAYAYASTSNSMVFGNAGITSIGGEVGWTIFSDGRYKKNIKENVPGLEFINKLRPVTYTVDVNSLNEYFKSSRRNSSFKTDEDNNTNAILNGSFDKAAKVIHTGFIAQEVEATANKLNYDFNGIDKPETKDKLYGLRYDEFVVPLVKAVQELSKQNNDLKSTNEDLEKKYEAQQKEIDELKAIIIDKTSQASSVSNQQKISLLQTAKLEQNLPNPTGQSTTKYFIPQQTSKAVIRISNATGAEIKSINLSIKNNGQVSFQTNNLSAGTYFYTLIVDGKTVDTKKMIIAH